MRATDVVYCMLTALGAAAAVRELRQGVLARSFGWRTRVDHLLHTAMALAMAVMPWHRGRLLPVVPLTVFFAAAAVWFPLTAAGRGRETRGTVFRRRLPYAAGMAAMAWMTHSMAGPSHTAPAAGLPAAHRAAQLGHCAGATKTGSVVTGVLALYLVVCALGSLMRDMPTLRSAPGTRAPATGTRGSYGHVWDGSLTLATVVMLLMHH